MTCEIKIGEVLSALDEKIRALKDEIYYKDAIIAELRRKIEAAEKEHNNETV
jgi:hypothetical protein